MTTFQVFIFLLLFNVVVMPAEELGFKHFIPPYANTSGFDILEGVNYASGAAGIRNETGTHAVDINYIFSF